MRQEQSQVIADNEKLENASKSERSYNRNGLIMANESFQTRNMPFVETFEICDYELADHDENDDLEREVNTKLSLTDDSCNIL